MTLRGVSPACGFVIASVGGFRVREKYRSPPGFWPQGLVTLEGQAGGSCHGLGLERSILQL